MVYRMIFNQTAYFGRGAIKEIPGVAKSHGFTKAFIVTDPVLLEKLGYIAEYEGRTKNRELEQIIKRRIAAFEQEHGEIPIEENDR